MNNCKRIEEETNLATNVVRMLKKQLFIKDIIILCLAIVLIMTSSYIIYDRYLDNEFEYAIEEISVSQDSAGYNNFINGNGEINNGAEN